MGLFSSLGLGWGGTSCWKVGVRLFALSQICILGIWGDRVRKKNLGILRPNPEKMMGAQQEQGVAEMGMGTKWEGAE